MGLLALVPFVIILAAIWAFNRKWERDENQIGQTPRPTVRRKH
jgi:hypothetical protein